MNALITGGSSGIGLAIAYQLAEQGANLFLVSRDLDKLEKSKALIKSKFDVKIYGYSCDVSDFSNLQHTVNTIEEEYPIDYLICCAGQMLCGKIDKIDSAELRDNMGVNYFGVLNAYKAVIPTMKKRNTGKIGIVSSVAGYFSAIGYGGYAPGKFALSGLAECLRMEAGDYGISVTLIYPPDTDTPMLEKEKRDTLPECLALTKHMNTMTPDQVAAKLLKGMGKNKFEVYCNLESKLLRWYRVMVPDLYFRKLDKMVRKDRIKRGVL